jgi:hypothetical protein
MRWGRRVMRLKKMKVKMLEKLEVEDNGVHCSKVLIKDEHGR